MLFLTDVDHVSFEKANETRQNNLHSVSCILAVHAPAKRIRNMPITATINEL